MNTLNKVIWGFYRHALAHPLIMLALLAAVAVAAAAHSRNFYYDASADTLVAEDDPELLYYREITNYFGDESFLFLTYTPETGDIFTPESIAKIQELASRLKEVKGVAKVTSVLNAPLLQSPPVPLAKMATDYRTLLSPDVDLDAARKELTNSPLFAEMLISRDGKSSAIRIDLAADATLKPIADERNHLRLIKNPTAEERARLRKVSKEYRRAYAESVKELERTLEDIRSISQGVRHEVVSYLGGVPMIASDMMRYVRNDLLMFGGGSLTLMVIALFAFFRRLRWVMLPLVTAGLSVLFTMGLLGALHTPVTVVSSNFISLLIILAISISVHLMSRYQEELKLNPNMPNTEVVQKTMAGKLAPCLYTTITTAVGFASLCTSSIVPVVDFGWIMCAGVFIALVVTYAFFPAGLLLCSRECAPRQRENRTPLVRIAYRLCFHHTLGVILLSVALAVLTVVGMSRLSLDNRFLDYFKTDTEIYQGLAFIDKNLGGTTPMDVIVNFPPYTPPELEEDDDFFTEEVDEYPQRYWFTPDKLEVLSKLQTYMEGRREIGKTVSLATLEAAARQFNDGKPLGAVEIVGTLNAMPEEVRGDFITPYAAPEAGLMRITSRLHETGPLFSRDKLIEDIETYATNTLKLPKGTVQVTGMNVLFNGMLKELFSSQTSTLGFVIGATFLMFWILLGSARLAIIGILPNVLAAFIILGFMGFAGIPLDMMTITIAAIVIGIGVDDAIHYLHRFREGFSHSHNVDDAIRKSHREIGQAIYFTSLTVVIGFSVLCASNFVPTVYFGILTSLAMICALMANLTLLPALLMKFYK